MTKSNLPDIFSGGNPSTIFPTDSDKERRLVSIFTSVLTRVGPLAHYMFKECGLDSWKRAKWEAFTEVTAASDPSGTIDGYVSASYGESRSSALIEAKVDTNLLKREQVSRYMKIAKENNIYAMITISNQRVTRPSHQLLKVSGTLTRSVILLHWSWAYIETQCRLFRNQYINLTDEQKFILGEFIDMISDPRSGTSRYEKMPSGWEKVVDDIVRKNKPSNISKFADAWIQEQQDLALQLSKEADVDVKVSLKKEHRKDYDLYKKYISDCMKKDHRLEASFDIPNAADKLYLVADIARKTVSTSMTLKISPESNMKTIKGYVSWISRMIQSNDNRIYIEPKFGNKPSNMVPLVDIKNDWRQIMQEEEYKNARPKLFKIMIYENLGEQFSSNKNFIKRIDNAVIDFYDIVGKNLKQC